MREEEDARMREAVEIFNGIAQSLRLAATLLPNWLPVRAAVSEVCGVDWDRLGHGTRTLLGAAVRDWFAEEFPAFALTPVRLLEKSNGGGSHMIAIYPLEWLIGKRDALLEAMGRQSARSPMLFGDDSPD